MHSVHLFSLLPALALASTLGAQGTSAAPAPPPVPTVAPSSFASTEIRFAGRYVYGRWMPTGTAVEGPARVTITYGQPHARGRQIVGKVIPLDTVWRLGANTATELRSDVDLTIGGTRIPHGVYTLWVWPSASGWQLIVNKEVGQFGTPADYTPAADLARIPLRMRTLPDPVESLSIYLVPPSRDAAGTPPKNPQGTLRIVWGTMELTADWALAEWSKPTATR